MAVYHSSNIEFINKETNDVKELNEEEIFKEFTFTEIDD